MRAVVLHEYGGPEKLKFEDNVPEPQISGSTVLIAAAAASVNPIDWKVRSGMRQKDFPLSFPTILGRDVSGVVRAVGANGCGEADREGKAERLLWLQRRVAGKRGGAKSGSEDYACFCEG